MFLIWLMTKTNQESKASATKANKNKNHPIHKVMIMIESPFTLIVISLSFVMLLKCEQAI